MTNYNEYADMIVKASKHATNAVFLMKSKKGSELPSKWNNWDNITNTVTIVDKAKKTKKSDTIVFKTASGYVDNISRDDLEQIASLAICEELACAESTKQFEYNELFEVAFTAIRRKVGQVQYNTHGRYQLRKKTDSAIIEELNKSNLTDEVNAILNKTDKSVKVAKEVGIDIYDRTSGPAYNQAKSMENSLYEPLQTKIYKNEKEEYILSHMKPELARLYIVYKNGFEPCNTTKKEVTANYIRKMMDYGNSISRQTINNRVTEMKQQYRKFAKEYDDFIKEVEYSNNYSLGLTKADSTKESVSYLAYLAKKARKARKTEIKRIKYTIRRDYITKQSEAHSSYLNRCKPIQNVAEHTESYNTQFKPAEHYVNPSITSIADVRGWKPKETNRNNELEIVPYETLEKAIKSKKTSLSSKLDMIAYVNKYYPTKAIKVRFELKERAENTLSEVVFDSSK